MKSSLAQDEGEAEVGEVVVVRVEGTALLPHLQAHVLLRQGRLHRPRLVLRRHQDQLLCLRRWTHRPPSQAEVLLAVAVAAEARREAEVPSHLTGWILARPAHRPAAARLRVQARAVTAILIDKPCSTIAPSSQDTSHQPIMLIHV